MSGTVSRPLIALTSYAESVSWGDVWRDVPAALLPWTYVDKVAEAGGAPVLLPPVPQAAADVVAKVDGLLLTGGPDIDPGRYGAPREPLTQPPQLARDATEFAALAAAQERGIPVLAICRGIQLLAAARGGTLFQHLPTHAPAIPGRFEPHPVRIKPDSHLGAALGDNATLYCHHHQGVDRLGAGLIPTAWAQDGGIEGVEDPSAPFLVGIQAHPEEGGDTEALFTAFVRAATSPPGPRKPGLSAH
ncbi:MAG TPA: gamma-glutamyl-gamma-aminobutyrate hydrolase family protein [Pseudonocardia sp.]